MQSDPQAILDAAMALPTDLRLTLVARLLESLPPDDAALSLDDPQLEAELDRRFADLSGAVSWSDLKSEK